MGFFNLFLFLYISFKFEFFSVLKKLYLINIPFLFFKWNRFWLYNHIQVLDIINAYLSNYIKPKKIPLLMEIEAKTPP